MSSVHKYNATDYDDALLRLVDLATNDNVSAAAIAGGGGSYVVGDILTVIGGTVVSGLVATLEVTSVAAGVIDGIRVFDCGSYSAQPGNPVSVSGGSGAGATFNLTFQTNNWILNRNVASSTSLIDYPGEQGGGGTQVLGREIQLEGVGNAGTDEIYVGFLEVDDSARGSFNWAIAGFTGFNSGEIWENQPGFSYSPPDEIAAFTPLSNGAIECWFYIAPRYLSGVLRMGSTYNNFFAGFTNPFATETEYPFPLYISGCSSRWNELFSTSGLSQSGLVDPGAFTSSGGNTKGPAGIRFVDGKWWDVKNWSTSGSTRVVFNDRAIYPAQQIIPRSSYIAAADQFLLDVALTSWRAIIPDVGVPGIGSQNLFPSDNPAGNETVLVPTMIYFTSPSLQILAELPDVFWGSTTGNNVVSQDRVIVGGVYYRAFQNCNRTDPFAFVYLREDA